MGWMVSFLPVASKELRKLDPDASRRILRFLFDRIASSRSPRRIGAALSGSQLGEFWKYRVGDYRVIAHLKDKMLLVLVVRIAHRRDIYRYKI